MTTPVNNWTDIPDADLTSPKAFSITTLFAIRNNIARLREMLSGSFAAGESIDHNHDGINSALLEVGPNLLRNGSFETGLNGFTPTAYTGGTVVSDSTNALHGIGCVAITSTVLSNGGGEVVSDEYIPCATGRSYSAFYLAKASIANISSKVELIWYDSAKAQISLSTQTTTNTPTTASPLGITAVAPATAAYVRSRIVGGVPATGTAVGTVYADGAVIQSCDSISPFVMPGINYSSNIYAITGGEKTGSVALTPSELANLRIMQSGIYRVSFEISQASGGYPSYGRIYKNGVAYGTTRSTTLSTPVAFTEDLYFSSGDTVQIFGWITTGGTVIVSNTKVGSSTTVPCLLFQPAAAAIGER